MVGVNFEGKAFVKNKALAYWGFPVPTTGTLVQEDLFFVGAAVKQRDTLNGVTYALTHLV